MKTHFIYIPLLLLTMLECNAQPKQLKADVFETSATGNKLKKRSDFSPGNISGVIQLLPDRKFQTILGFGGSFTEASASLMNKISKKNRDLILDAYFGENGARYSLTRTHINSCDFSLGQYSYAPVADDTELKHFSVEPDKDDIIPMIKDAMSVSKEGFKIISSPWTAPPWMKDNNDWRGGKLLPKYYETWALYFAKYIEAYKAEGIDIWGVTVENEPLGNDKNWESMHYTPQEMTDFVKNYLGKKLNSDGLQVKILGYDQNRGEELEKWADVMFENEASSRYFDGTAIHWYASTYDIFAKSLQHTHKAAPGKFIIQTEACVDAEIPKWKDDKWYWSKEATDWGWDWATEKDKYLHPKYVPVFRYANDIIGCMNNWVNGWIDWNMVLDKQGGPNWFKNWCVAPVIVDPENDEVYFTPLYNVMEHFSKFIRPRAVRIRFKNSDDQLMVTAAQNPDGTIAVVILNQTTMPKSLTIKLHNKVTKIDINGEALQTVMIYPVK